MRITFAISIFLSSMMIYAQPSIGTLSLNEQSAAHGYTLISPISSTITYLIDNCGHIINKWESNYDVGISAYIDQNGVLTRTGRAGNAPLTIGGAGGAIEQYDWEGNLIWEYIYNDENVLQHHDIHLMNNGNILFLSLERKSPEEAIQAGRDSSTLDSRGLYNDTVIEINPSTNEIVWTWSLWDHLVQDFDSSKDNYGIIAENPRRIDINYSSVKNPDFIHLNSVDYDPVLDQVLLSSNNIGEIFLIDHSTTDAEASSSQGGNTNHGGDLLWRWGDRSNYDRGTDLDDFFYNQHSARFISSGRDKGKIIVFNNGSSRPGTENYSTIETIAPLRDGFNYEMDTEGRFLPLEQDWIFDADRQYFSARMSSCIRLDNDNTLIAYANLGRIIEIDPNENVVWTYEVPTRAGVAQSQGSNPSLNDIFHTIKYSVSYFSTDLNFTIGPTIELDMERSFCALTSSLKEDPTTREIADIYPNPFTNTLHFNIPMDNIWIYNMSGKLVSYHQLHQVSELNLNLDLGMYIIKSQDYKGSFYSYKLFKL